jgi:hypothetical protein
VGTCSYRAMLPGALESIGIPTSAFSAVSHFNRSFCVLHLILDHLLCIAPWLFGFLVIYSADKWLPTSSPTSFCTTWPAPRASASLPLSGAFVSCSIIRISLIKPSSSSFQTLSPRLRNCGLHLPRFGFHSTPNPIPSLPFISMSRYKARPCIIHESSHKLTLNSSVAWFRGKPHQDPNTLSPQSNMCQPTHTLWTHFRSRCF